MVESLIEQKTLEQVEFIHRLVAVHKQVLRTEAIINKKIPSNVIRESAQDHLIRQGILNKKMLYGQQFLMYHPPGVVYITLT
ncbi:hypothetical protein GWK91_02740 [Virgibacillus sp. MSP4-1]|uniref:hypothetical protein n=1 Tax=Virgibacillus sp. MSP4-1 TaxID=2700081 RepID=UPI00039E872B|nr:hypothetical protein [Virgibacillus sp. MSP4-1]QHS21923.1 hypothetical protein GWK91_02740 [Virgibacillus sp. MSP4-1]